MFHRLGCRPDPCSGTPRLLRGQRLAQDEVSVRAVHQSHLRACHERDGSGTICSRPPSKGWVSPSTRTIERSQCTVGWFADDTTIAHQLSLAPMQWHTVHVKGDRKSGARCRKAQGVERCPSCRSRLNLVQLLTLTLDRLENVHSTG
jgi:hypothetical protein